MWQGHPPLQLLFPASHLLLGILSWSQTGHSFSFTSRMKFSVLSLDLRPLLGFSKIWGAPAGGKASRSVGCQAFGLVKGSLCPATLPSMLWRALGEPEATLLQLPACC